MSPPWAKKKKETNGGDAEADAAARAAEEGQKRESSAGSLFHESDSEFDEDDEVQDPATRPLIIQLECRAILDSIHFSKVESQIFDRMRILLCGGAHRANSSTRGISGQRRLISPAERLTSPTRVRPGASGSGAAHCSDCVRAYLMQRTVGAARGVAPRENNTGPVSCASSSRRALLYPAGLRLHPGSRTHRLCLNLPLLSVENRGHSPLV